MTKQTQTNKLIYDVGTNDLADPVRVNRKVLKFYDTWKGMIERCYSEKFHIKNPTYRGCTVCDSWLLLSNFREWFNANYREGLALDKDILIPGNKVYRPEACSFVPRYINNLLTDAGAARGDLPCGVSALKPNPKTGEVAYRAQCRNGHGGHPHKDFRTIPEARQWYITTKKKVANEQAIHALEAGDITDDVYRALITREW